MLKIINKLFYFLKFLLLIASFVLCLYVIVYMYQRLQKNLSESVSVFLPFALLFILFSVNMILNQKGVKDNLFYNITCCVVFAFLIFAGYRAIADKYMIANEKQGFGINFNYYADQIAPMKVMLYGLIISNICFMFDKREKREKKTQKVVSHDEDVTVEV